MSTPRDDDMGAGWRYGGSVRQIRPSCTSCTQPSRRMRQEQLQGEKNKITCVDAAIKELERRLEPVGLIPRDVPRDGNCFFHAVAREVVRIIGQEEARALLGCQQVNHMAVRRFLCDWANPGRYARAKALAPTPPYAPITLVRH